MRSPRSPFGWLIAKEWRELLSSRAWWVLLLAMGPLVGVSFTSAVWTYAEASGLNGTAAGVGEAFSPLIGVWAPTFSACELAAAFLLPFVGIRLVAGDLQSGALKIELQSGLSSFTRMTAKGLVLLVAWLIASLAPLAAVGLWMSYGGAVNLRELLTVFGGHLLNAGLTIALAAATPAMAEHPSTAAILTLAVTVGTWILDFIAAVHGGLWERIAGYTPTAMVAEFQHGLIRLDVVLIAVTFVASGLLLAAIWMRIGTPAGHRVRESVALAGIAATVVVGSSMLVHANWDVSENRANSFSRSEESALRRLQAPLRMEVHLAPQDPRRADLDQRTIAKLRRVLRRFEVRYVSATSIGLFEQTNEDYGEIRYELDGRHAVNRLTTAEGVLETIFTLAGIEPEPESEADVYRGHPLAVPPRGAPMFFYGIWPALVAVAAFIARRRTP